MIRLTVDNVYTKIDCDDDSLMKWVKSKLTFKDPDAIWKMRRAGGYYSPNVCFLSEKKKIFPSGFFTSLINELRESFDNDCIEVIDNRSIQKEIEQVAVNMVPDVELRDYQMEAIEEIKKNRRGIIKVGTGGGKTEIAIATCIVFGETKFLFICDRFDLVEQSVKRFRKRGISATSAFHGTTKDLTGRIVCCTRQSMSNLAAPELKQFGGVIFDECHHAQSSENRKLLRSCIGASIRIGLSGTPFVDNKLKNAYVQSQLGQIIYEVPAAQLIERGLLAKPIIRFIEYASDPVVGDYATVYDNGIMYNANRNKLIIKLAKVLKGKTLILFLRIPHGDFLYENLKSYHGNDVMLCHGSTDKSERAKMFDAFNSASQSVLIASSIVDEGIDFDLGLHNLIIASGTKSEIKTIQRLGRALRINDTMKVSVFDFWDDAHDILLRHSRERKKIWEDESHEVRFIKV